MILEYSKQVYSNLFRSLSNKDYQVNFKWEWIDN